MSRFLIRVPKSFLFSLITLGIVTAPSTLWAGGSCATNITAGEVDDFDITGDIECWNGTPPTQMDDSGNMGAGDGALVLGADGAGPGGKLLMYNRDQWSGDFTAVGSAVEVTFEANNTGANPLTLRLAVGDEVAANPAPPTASWFVTSDATAVALGAGSGWTTVSFTLSAADMVQALDSTNSDAGTLDDVLAGVAEFRILHSAAANHGPDVDFITATLLIDDIRITQLPVELQSFSVE